MAIKLVISDIDGTLVMHQNHLNDLARADALISQATIDAIGQLHTEGIMLAGVTGRTFDQSKDILTTLGIKGPCVFAGGAIIRNLPDGEVLYEANLEEKSVAEVTAILSKYLADGRSIELNPSTLDPTKYNSIWAKLRKSDTEAVRKELSNVPSVYFVMNDGHGHKGEFGVAVLNKGANKGSATKRLLSLLNIHPLEAVCVGDGDNDIPMFSECGLGIAMGNGTESLKKVAHHVVAPIEDEGFAAAVRIIANKHPVTNLI